MYDLYAMAHTASYKKAKAFSESDLDHPEMFTNISSHHKLVTYNEEGKASGAAGAPPRLDLPLCSLLFRVPVFWQKTVFIFPEIRNSDCAEILTHFFHILASLSPK